MTAIPEKKRRLFDLDFLDPYQGKGSPGEIPVFELKRLFWAFGLVQWPSFLGYVWQIDLPKIKQTNEVWIDSIRYWLHSEVYATDGTHCLIVCRRQ